MSFDISLIIHHCLKQEDYTVSGGKSTVELPGNWESVPANSQVETNADASRRRHAALLEEQVGGARRAASSR